MVSRQRWMEFFVGHSEQHPGGVIDRLFSDWQKAKADADSVRSKETPAPLWRPNRDSPGRIARMLAERMRRRS